MSYQIGDVANWVVGRLKRPEALAQTVENAVNFYELLVSSIPFEEYETLSEERALESGEVVHDISDLNINAILSVRLTNGAQKRRLKRSHTRLYDSLNSVVPGIPATYARFAKTVELNPTPSSSAMTLRLRYWAGVVRATADAETVILLPNIWMELMRYETLYRTYMDFQQVEMAAQLVSPMPVQRTPNPHTTKVFEYGIIPKLWNDLLKTVKQRENGDEDFSINPVVRRYTYV